MRFKQLAISSLCCVLPLAVHAEPNKRDGGGGNQGGGPGFRGKPFSEATEEEKKQSAKELAEFCEKYSPSRWADIKKSESEKPDRHFGVRWQMFWRLKGLKMLQKEDPRLYDIKVGQIRVEDDEYRLLKARAAPDDVEANPEKLTPDAINAQLRDTAKRHVELRLAERQHRLERLNAMLKKEQDELAADTDSKAKEALAQKHFDKIVEQGPILMPSPPRRERGEGEGGPGGPGGGRGGPGVGPGFGGGPDGRPPRDGDKDK